MIISVDSNCDNAVFDSIEYICDKCQMVSLKATSTDDLSELEEIFDYNCGYENELICWECSSNTRPIDIDEL